MRYAPWLTILAVMLCTQPAAAVDHVAPKSLRSYATLHAVGFEWDLDGDNNHNATCTVRYRAAGSNLHDADDGSLRRSHTISTRPAPVLPGGHLVYVHANPTSGDGSLSAPLSMQAAVESAVPGHVHCLLPGNYGQVTLTHPGTTAGHVAWLGPAAAQRAGFDMPNGEAVFERIEVSAEFQWLEGLHFAWNHAWPDSVIRGGLKATSGTATDLVVRDNRFNGYAYSIWLEPDADRWIISDNTIVGRKDIELEGSIAYSGEGIELQHSSGHTVAHNTISQVADGISYATRNCDIFANDIFDTSDDGIEPDYGYANIRMWSNRIANTHYHAFSFQGMSVGPWYFIRNQVTTARGAIFKFRVTDRIVVVNNTFVAPSLGRDALHHLLHGVVRNNLYVRDGEMSSEPWRAAWKYRGPSIEKRYFNPDLIEPDWRSDWDYNGYDLNDGDDRGAFVWFDQSFASVAELSAAANIEAHGVEVDRQRIFVDFSSPTHPARRPGSVLTLHPGGAAVDRGAPLPNLADQFAGVAPDLGAHELGSPAPQYGPRIPAQRNW